MAEPAAASEKPEEADKPQKLDDAAFSSTSMEVKVYSPYKVYFEGPALSVSAASATGPFDILPRHHNFITLLVACDLVVRTDGDEQTISIGGGIMHVKANEVTVFLDV